MKNQLQAGPCGSSNTYHVTRHVQLLTSIHKAAIFVPGMHTSIGVSSCLSFLRTMRRHTGRVCSFLSCANHASRQEHTACLKRSGLPSPLSMCVLRRSHQEKRVERPKYETGGEYEEEPERDGCYRARIEPKPPPTSAAPTAATEHHRGARGMTPPASPPSGRKRARCRRSPLQADPMAERSRPSMHLRGGEPCSPVQQSRRYRCRYSRGRQKEPCAW